MVIYKYPPPIQKIGGYVTLAVFLTIAIVMLWNMAINVCQRYKIRRLLKQIDNLNNRQNTKQTLRKP